MIKPDVDKLLEDAFNGDSIAKTILKTVLIQYYEEYALPPSEAKSIDEITTALIDKGLEDVKSLMDLLYVIPDQMNEELMNNTKFSDKGCMVSDLDYLGRYLQKLRIPVAYDELDLPYDNTIHDDDMLGIGD